MVETDFVIRARRSLRGRGRGYLTEGGNGRGEMKCRNFLSGPKPRKIKAMLPCRDPSLWFQPSRRGVSTFKVESRDVL